jgi:hypothetical protein
MYDFIWEESDVTLDTTKEGHGVHLHENEAWKRKRQEFTSAIGVLEVCVASS